MFAKLHQLVVLLWISPGLSHRISLADPELADIFTGGIPNDKKPPRDLLSSHKSDERRLPMPSTSVLSQPPWCLFIDWYQLHYTRTAGLRNPMIDFILFDTSLLVAVSMCPKSTKGIVLGSQQVVSAVRGVPLHGRHSITPLRRVAKLNSGARWCPPWSTAAGDRRCG